MRVVTVFLALTLSLLACGSGRVSTARAKKLYEEYLSKHLPGFAVESFEEVPMKGDSLAEVAQWFQVFRAQTTRVEGTYHVHTWVVGQDDEGGVWEATFESRRDLLDRSGLLATDEVSVRKAGIALLLFPTPVEFDAARVEVQGREFRYHEHRLTLLSGRLGTYTEDVVFRFDESGRLAESTSTGYPDLTAEQAHALLSPPDPWLQLSGFVRDELKKAVADAAANRAAIQDHCK